MSTIISSVRASNSLSIASKNPKTKCRRWIVALSILILPVMAQQAEARKMKKSDYCFEHGCKGEKCICCER